MVAIPTSAASQRASVPKRASSSAKDWIAGKVVGNFQRDDVNVAALVKRNARLIRRLRLADPRIAKIASKENRVLGPKLYDAVVAYDLSPGSYTFHNPNKVRQVLDALRFLSGSDFDYESFKGKLAAAHAKSRSRRRSPSIKRSPIVTRQRKTRLPTDKGSPIATRRRKS